MKQKTVSIIIAVAVTSVTDSRGALRFYCGQYRRCRKNSSRAKRLIPVAYVDGIWESRLLPTFNEKAVELSKILSEMKPDANGTAPKES